MKLTTGSQSGMKMLTLWDQKEGSEKLGKYRNIIEENKS